jgi:hypothetical protein
MIKRRSLFVLGAGASRPFGFPVGEDLRQQIISAPNSDLIKFCGVQPTTLAEFTDDFRRSGFSIDRFLAHRPEYERVGRLSIASALLPAESDGHLHASGGTGDSDWYRSLWLRLTDGLTEKEQLAHNNVRFITFNYDRSLERYLHLTAAAAFGLSMDQAYQLVERLFPTHVYGALGKYRATNGDYSYGGDSPMFQQAADGLLVMPNARPDADPALEDAFGWAQQVFFIGFSFDPMNCARLGALRPLSSISQAGPIRVHGTAWKFNAHEQAMARTNVVGESGSMSFLDLDAKAAMREWTPLFQAAV